MKKLRILTALALVLCMMLVMAASCGGSGYVIKVGERTVSEAMYENTAKSYKSNFLTSYGMESATDAELSEIWDQYTDENQTSTVGDYLDSAVQNYLITNMLFSNQFDKLGLTLSDETISEIELEVEQMANQAGGLESLRDTLMEVNGITYEEFVDQYYDSAKRTAVVQYYFGENGAEHPVSEQEIADYYTENYARVKHVLLLTVDESTSEPLDDEAVAQAEQTANEVYELATMDNGGVDNFDQLIDEYNQDPGMSTYPEGYRIHKDDNTYDTAFKDAAFDMEIGEVRIVKGSFGYHVMKRYNVTDEETFTAEDKEMLLENMMSEEINGLLDQWLLETPAEINDALVQKYSVRSVSLS